MALAFASVGAELNNFRIVGRDAAARQGMEKLWDALYREVATVYRGEPFYDDIQDMLHACTGEVGPGAMPAADWIIHLHNERREPPTGIDVTLLGDIRARRAPRNPPAPSSSPAADADEAAIDADIEHYVAAGLQEPVRVAYEV